VYKLILACVDGSAFAEQVVPTAVSLAERAGATLELVLVREPMPAWAAVPDLGPTEVQARQAEERYLADLADRIRGTSKVPLETSLLEPLTTSQMSAFAVRQGLTGDLLNRPVAAAIALHASARQAGLVVLGTHGRGAFSRFWLGSVADEVARSVSMPVLLLRPEPGAAPAPATLRHLLVPLDRSPLAEAALAAAAALAKLTGAKLTLFHAVEMVSPFPDQPAPGGVAEYWRASGAAYLAEQAERLRAEGLTVEYTAAVSAGPAEAITGAAAQVGADAIAMATHGARGVRRLLLGSVADRVVRSTQLPVLLVRPPR